MGQHAAPHVQTDHRRLNRAVWSPLTTSRLLRRLIVAVCVPRGVVFGRDDTIARRRGARMQAQGLDRAPVRASRAHWVNVSGLRWLCGLLLTHLPWAQRVWALPCMTGLGPSARFDEQRHRRHRTLVERAWHIIRLVGRWLPQQAVVLVADRRDAVLEWLHPVQTWSRASLMTRLRLDAALYAPPAPREPGQRGRPRRTGARRPTLEAVLAAEETRWTPLRMEPWYGEGPREVEGCTATALWSHPGKPPVPSRWVLVRAPQGQFESQAFVSTPHHQTPAQMLSWCIRRWAMEVTCEEARAQLGMATPRQWKARAMARTTPAWLGLESIITLTAHLLMHQGVTCVRSTAWYTTIRPTVSETIALVRRQVWDHLHISMSQQEVDMIKIPRVWFERFTEALCDAASLDKVELRTR